MNKILFSVIILCGCRSSTSVRRTVDSDVLNTNLEPCYNTSGKSNQETNLTHPLDVLFQFQEGWVVPSALVSFQKHKHNQFVLTCLNEALSPNISALTELYPGDLNGLGKQITIYLINGTTKGNSVRGKFLFVPGNCLGHQFKPANQKFHETSVRAMIQNAPPSAQSEMIKLVNDSDLFLSDPPKWEVKFVIKNGKLTSAEGWWGTTLTGKWAAKANEGDAQRIDKPNQR